MATTETTTRQGARAVTQLLPKQYEFVASEAPEIMYSGAFGAGKTRALCLRALRKASEHRGIKFGLCRKTAVSLRATTLRTLLEPDGDLPPVLPKGSYTYRRVPGEERIQLHRGGEIVPFGCDNPLTVGSLQLTDCGVDEGVELDKEEWDMLLGRCRVQFTFPDGRTNKNTLSTACNPGSPSHFLHTLFYEEGGLNRHLIETSALENWFLPPDYIEKLSRTLHGPALERYVHGRWAITEGAVYPMFSLSLHIVHNPGPFQRYVGGVDEGFVNPMVLRVHGVDSDDRAHVVSEFYRTGIHPAEFVDTARMAASVYSPMTFVVDPSAAALISALRLANLNVVKANNDVLGGIGVVQNALMPDELGKPRLTMEPTCTEGNLEYLGYRWNDKTLKDAPVKENDHACDADRYAMMYITNSRGKRRLSVGGAVTTNRRLSVTEPVWR